MRITHGYIGVQGYHIQPIRHGLPFRAYSVLVWGDLLRATRLYTLLSISDHKNKKTNYSKVEGPNPALGVCEMSYIVIFIYIGIVRDTTGRLGWKFEDFEKGLRKYFFKFNPAKIYFQKNERSDLRICS